MEAEPQDDTVGVRQSIHATHAETSSQQVKSSIPKRARCARSPVPEKQTIVSAVRRVEAYRNTRLKSLRKRRNLPSETLRDIRETPFTRTSRRSHPSPVYTNLNKSSQKQDERFLEQVRTTARSIHFLRETKRGNKNVQFSQIPADGAQESLCSNDAYGRTSRKKNLLHITKNSRKRHAITKYSGRREST